jgi:pimeloyl-ACP methyl ester carboxylesterase
MKVGKTLLKGIASFSILIVIGANWVNVASAAPDRPLVFVPGILGSRLIDREGKVVWGEINSLYNFGRLEIGPEGPVLALKSGGLMQNINVLGPFWTIHGYDALIEQLHELGYVEGTNFFVFAYDWRQSNFDTARELDSFVKSTPALSATKFDIIAHSMGGMVTKIWCLEQGGAQRVHKVIYMGTPFQGSMNAFATLSEGWGPLVNVVAGGIDAIRRVALSFPSLYELFPTYDHCCRVGTPQKFTYLNVLNPTAWRDRDWLPAEYRATGPRATAFDKGLANAQRVGNLMRNPAPSIEEVKFAGDVVATRLWLYVDAAEQSWRHWSFSTSRGDGTVPVWSANNDFETEAGSNPTFAEHATIFEDRGLANKVARELVGGPPPPVREQGVDEVSTLEGAKRLSLFRAELSPPVVTMGGKSELQLTLEFADDVVPGDIKPAASLRGPTLPAAISMKETTTANDVTLRRLTFVGEIVAPAELGTHRVDITVPGKSSIAAYLSVFPSTGSNP